MASFDDLYKVQKKDLKKAVDVLTDAFSDDSMTASLVASLHVVQGMPLGVLKAECNMSPSSTSLGRILASSLRSYAASKPPR